MLFKALITLATIVDSRRFQRLQCRPILVEIDDYSRHVDEA